jgi:Ran GTPase-activating protein (RanGAP) involved in mRNA processing and transport
MSTNNVKNKNTATIDSLLQLLKRVRHDDPNVQHVCIEHRRLPTKYVVALLHAVSKSSHVTKLKLCNVVKGVANDDDSTAKAVAKCLRKNTSLTMVSLNKNQFSDAGCRQIASALRHAGRRGSALRRLNLEQNQIGDEGIDQLCRAVRTIPSLTILKLGKNNFGVQGLRSIALLLRHPGCPTRLQSLDLRSNRIGNLGATILADALCHNRTLLQLYLNGNHLDNRGVARLGAALCTNQHLRTLDLQRNDFDDTGAAAFSNALIHNNDSLTKLKIRHTRVSENVKSELQELLLMNSYGPDLARRTKRAMARLMQLQQQQQLQELQQQLQQVVEHYPDRSSDGDDDDMDGSSILSSDGFPLRLANERDIEPSSSECVICFDHIPSDCALLLPCQHANCCMDCSKRLEGCHMCRSEIVKVVPLSPAGRTLFRAYC